MPVAVCRSDLWRKDLELLVDLCLCPHTYFKQVALMGVLRSEVAEWQVAAFGLRLGCSRCHRGSMLIARPTYYYVALVVAKQKANEGQRQIHVRHDTHTRVVASVYTLLESSLAQYYVVSYQQCCSDRYATAEQWQIAPSQFCCACSVMR